MLQSWRFSVDWVFLPFILSLFYRTKALVLELLAAVCLVRGGHEIILSAFDNFKEVRAVLRRRSWGFRGGGGASEETNMSLTSLTALLRTVTQPWRNAPRADVWPAHFLISAGRIASRSAFVPQITDGAGCTGLARSPGRTVTCVSTGFGRDTKA